MQLEPDVGSDLLAAALTHGGSVRIGPGEAAALDLEQWASAQRRALLQLDTVDCASGDELIHAMSDVFAFPEDAVSDWDSLDEELADYEVSPAEGLLVVWSNWDSVALDDERGMAVAVDVLRTAAQSWCDDGVTWTVLVVGDGPGWDLPWAGEPPVPWEQQDTEEVDDFEEPDDDLEAKEEDADVGADVGAGGGW